MKSRTLHCLLVVLSLISAAAWSEGFYVDLFPKSKADIELIFDTLEAGAEISRTDEPPVVIMLHGKEAGRFLRSSYTENKSLIDQAAKLTAYQLIDVKICETWMRNNGHSTTDLFPFVSTVPYGQAELERLAEEESYTEYDVDL